MDFGQIHEIATYSKIKTTHTHTTCKHTTVKVFYNSGKLMVEVKKNFFLKTRTAAQSNFKVQSDFTDFSLAISIKFLHRKVIHKLSTEEIQAVCKPNRWTDRIMIRWVHT